MKSLAVTSLLLPITTKYWTRLGLDPSTLSVEPSVEKLRVLQERHLAQIPFENLAQHGCVGGPAVLDLETTANKILDQQRGGFCFELNTLFGTFLQQIGYQVRFVLANVHTGDGYRDKRTHVVLIVTCQSGKDESTVLHYCDVGFGEPPLHPLDYEAFGVEQETPEGMKSKLVRNKDQVELYWLKDGSWQPRLKWNYEQSVSGVELKDMADGLAAVQSSESNFSQKLIVTRLTRTDKMTLAGSRYKKTGPPRFQETGAQGPKTIQQLASSLEVKKILQDTFGIPISTTKGLSLEKSNSVTEEVWSQF